MPEQGVFVPALVDGDNPGHLAPKLLRERVDDVVFVMSDDQRLSALGGPEYPPQDHAAEVAPRINGVKRPASCTPEVAQQPHALMQGEFGAKHHNAPCVLDNTSMPFWA